MATALDEVVLSEFEALYGWRPDQADEIAIAASVARATCGRMGRTLPDLDWPVPYATFAAAMGDDGPSSSPKPATATLLPEVSSGGGPILAIPLELAAAWRGTEGTTPADYDRACEPDNYQSTEYGGVGWVTVGDGRALVLDLELVTAVVITERGVTVVRNYDEEPTPDAMQARIDAVPEGAWHSLDETLQLTERGLVVFDAAMPGAADPDAIESEEGVASVALEAGVYTIDIATHEGVDVIRLQTTQR